MGESLEESGGASDDGLSTSAVSKKNFVTMAGERFQLGLHGWKRKCLFVLLSMLIFLSSLNLALTVWVLRAIEFSSSGIGPLNILQDGVHLDGEASVFGNLIASKIQSRNGKELQIESSSKIRLNSRSLSGKRSTQLVLDDNSLEVFASSLKITDSIENTLFSVNKNQQLVIGSNSLGITGDGGVISKDSIQTPKVKADSGQDLTLESSTMSLDIFGSPGVNIVSDAITATALNNINLISKTGTVNLVASNIYLHNLSTVSTTDFSFSKRVGTQTRQTFFKIYQLCICELGRIFMAPPEVDCVSENSFCTTNELPN